MCHKLRKTLSYVFFVPFTCREMVRKVAAKVIVDE